MEHEHIEVDQRIQMKKFHLGDVLSIITGRLVSPRHIDGVYAILHFMTDDNVFTHAIPRVIAECKPYLVKQFPQLDSSKMDAALATLGETLEDKRGKIEAAKLVEVWLARQIEEYGEMLDVESIPKDAHAVKHPLAEIGEMRERRLVQ